MSAFTLSRRVSQAGFSPNAAASQRAKQLKAQGRDILDLTIGEPDFETPDHIKAAAVQALANGDTRYTPTLGTAALRAAISAKLARENQLNFPPAQIAVGNGAKQVIFNAFAATLDPGHEVIIPAPFYPSFPEMVSLNDGKPVIVPTRAEDGFKLTRASLEAAITPRTRWLVINSPSNPSGAVYGRDDLLMLAEVLRAHPQVLLLLDEVYEHILFTDTPPPHFLHVAQDLVERVLVVNGVSKTYAMTGWRVGYGAGPAALIQAMGVIQVQSTSGASSISQAAAVTALGGDQSFVKERTAAYRARRNILVKGLTAIEGIELQPPEGGLFVFSSCKGLLGKSTPDGKKIATDEDFVEYLLESAGVAGIAGSGYGLPGHFRLSIAASTESVSVASARIADAVARLS
ncbi:MAG: aspartate aminotransferase [Proteobacteria bacterium]|nr:aspartate aminotransferase [Pseudomonadota bacterium]